MIDEINDLISDISYKMNYDACDYVMSMKLFPAQVSKGSVEEIAQSALGEEVVIYEIKPATNQHVLDSVKFALTHYEDETPLPYTLSEEYKKNSNLLREFLTSMLCGSHYIQQFDLSYSTHPFYPVMWDFAYCITFKEGNAVLLVASASD